MRLLRNKNIALMLASLAFGAGLQAVQIIGKTSSTNDFTNTITAKTFDRCTGTFYVGITAGEAAYAIASAGPSATNFTPLAADSDVNNKGIAQLSLLPKDLITCDGCDCSGTAAQFIAASFDTNQTGSQFIAVGDVAGTNFVLSGPLANATSPSHTIRRVSYITTNTFEVFARGVAAGGAVFPGMDPTGSSIDTIRVDGAVSGPQLRILQGAVGGTAGVRLDRTSSAIRYGPSNAGGLRVNDMYWDTDLNTLYIASTVFSLPLANRTVFGLVKGTVNSAGQLTLSYITTGTPLRNSPNAIIGFASNDATVTATVDIRKVRAMKTSTGLDYLIINGGVRSSNLGSVLPGNKIYALPLGSLTTSQQGMIVTPTVSFATGCNSIPFFDTATTVSFQFLNNFLDGISADYVLSTTVGGCQAPWRQDLFATDMNVVGDTVYVTSSLRERQADGADDPGIWASQAMFDNTGKIISWTQWERVFPSTGGGIGAASDSDRIPLFSVDTATGKVWAVNLARTEVTRTQWQTTGFATGSLAQVINSSLTDGVYSMLDLIGATPTCAGPLGFAGTNTFDIFGGFEKVLFIHADGSGNTVTLPTAFGTAANSALTTTGLTGAGAVISLGYTFNDFNNYFIAGTQKGLYLYANTSGASFATNVTGFTDLATAPFTASGEWFPISGINAAIKSIVASDGRIYVLAQDITTIGGIVDKLYELTILGTVTSTAATLRLVAQSGFGSFPLNATMTGFTTASNLHRLSATLEGAPCASYGVISTNDGIWTSTADLTRLVNIAGEWITVPGTDGIGFNFLRNASKEYVDNTGSDTTSSLKSQKVWGIYFTDRANGCPAPFGIFQNSRFIQIGNDTSGSCFDEAGGGSIGSGGFAALPQCECPECVNDAQFWTSRCNINGNNRLDFSLQLWSDGARRFFTRFSPTDTVYNSLQSLPYRCDQACMSAPYSDPDLSTVQRINWIENISGTGQIVAGTDTGVVVLD